MKQRQKDLTPLQEVRESIHMLEISIGETEYALSHKDELLQQVDDQIGELRFKRLAIEAKAKQAPEELTALRLRLKKVRAKEAGITDIGGKLDKYHRLQAQLAKLQKELQAEGQLKGK